MTDEVIQLTFADYWILLESSRSYEKHTICENPNGMCCECYERYGTEPGFCMNAKTVVYKIDVMELLDKPRPRRNKKGKFNYDSKVSPSLAEWIRDNQNYFFSLSFEDRYVVTLEKLAELAREYYEDTN